MNPTLLVIDGRGAPRLLQQSLAKRGYRCLYARGPLKVRALLGSATVDLIVWKDNKTDPALNADYFREWSVHGQIPIIRLFTKAPAADAAPLPPQIVGSIAAEAPEEQIHGAIERVLACNPPFAALLPGGEMAFRHALSNRPPQMLTSGIQSGAPPPASPLTADTAVQPQERLLLQAAAEPRKTKGSSAPRQWRRLLAWLTPGRPAPLPDTLGNAGPS